LLLQIDTIGSKTAIVDPVDDTEAEESLNLRNPAEVADEAPSLVTPDAPSRPQTPESQEQSRRMAEVLGKSGGTTRPLITNKTLQTLPAAQNQPARSSLAKEYVSAYDNTKNRTHPVTSTDPDT